MHQSQPQPQELQPQELQELQPQPVLLPDTEPQELQPQELQELQPQPLLMPATLPLQQGLQQEFETKSGNQIPLELQELQAIKKSS